MGVCGGGVCVRGAGIFVLVYVDQGEAVRGFPLNNGMMPEIEHVIVIVHNVNRYAFPLRPDKIFKSGAGFDLSFFIRVFKYNFVPLF